MLNCDSNFRPISFRNYIIDYIFEYAELTNAFKLLKVTKRFFKLLKDKEQIQNWLRKVIIIPYNKIIRVFDQSMNLIKQLNGHTDRVICLTKLNDDLIASGSGDETVKIWNIHSGECIRTLKGHTYSVFALIVLQNGFLASGGWDKTIRIWDKDYNCIKTLKENSNEIQCLLTLHNGWLVSGSYDKLIKVYDPNADYKCIQTLKGHNDCVTSIKQLPSNDLVSISLDDPGTIIIWNFNVQFKKVKEWKTGYYGKSLCLLPDNRIASGHLDNIILIWDVATMECLSKLEGHTGDYGLEALLLLSNGHLVSAGFESEVILWKPSDDNKTFIETKRIDNNYSWFSSMLEL